MKLNKAEILILILLFLALFSNGQTVTSKDGGKTYVSVKKTKTAKETTNTGKVYQDSKGNFYPIMKTDSSYFVIRTSAKTGNQYKQYLKIQN